MGDFMRGAIEEVIALLKPCNTEIDAEAVDILEITAKEYDERVLTNTCIQPSDITNVACFDHIIGAESAKATLVENVVLPLGLHPTLREKVFSGVRRGSVNVLLYGPPGCGKTILARASAYESRAVFFSIKPSDLHSKYIGESEKYIRKLFISARSYDRAIIFFDEFDSLAQDRSGEDGFGRRLLCELLIQMNDNAASYVQSQVSVPLPDSPITSHTSNSSPLSLSATKSKRSKRTLELDYTVPESNERGMMGISNMSIKMPPVVLAATNRASDLDEAILRRFPCKVFVGLPSVSDRTTFFQRKLQGIASEIDENDMTHIIELTEGWNFCEIEALTREAAMEPIRDVHDYLLTLRYDIDQTISQTNVSVPFIRAVYYGDFERSFKRMLVVEESQQQLPVQESES
jgi:fidgetin-like protein 1